MKYEKVCFIVHDTGVDQLEKLLKNMTPETKRNSQALVLGPTSYVSDSECCIYHLVCIDDPYLGKFKSSIKGSMPKNVIFFKFEKLKNETYHDVKYYMRYMETSGLTFDTLAQ